MAIVTTSAVTAGSTSLPSANAEFSSRMALLNENGAVIFNAPYASNDVKYDGLVRGYTEVPRAIGAPLLLPNDFALRKITFTLALARIDYRDSVEDLIRTLLTISKASERVRLKYGPMENDYTWRVTACSLDVSRRNEFNEITRGTMSMELTQASDTAVYVGPVSGGTTVPVSAQAPVKTTPVIAVRKTTTKYYIVKSGDTLWAIAGKFYHNNARCVDIAKLNGIKDPRKLMIGLKLKLP